MKIILEKITSEKQFTRGTSHVYFFHLGKNLANTYGFIIEFIGKKIEMFFLNMNDSVLMNSQTHVFATPKCNFSLGLRFGYTFISKDVKLLNKDHV